MISILECKKIESKNAVVLNSSLDEEMFAKTKFSSLLDDVGVIVEKDKNGEYTVFSNWKFSYSKTIKNNVYFVGEGFSGCSVASMPSKKFSNDEIRSVIFAICQAYTFAIENNIVLPCTGPSSILFEKKSARLLFAPPVAFEKSCANLGKEKYNLILDSWKYSALPSSLGMSFTLSVYVYFALTKNLPYPPELDEDKSVSLAYKRFLPLEFAVNGVNEELAFYVDRALCGKKELINFPLEKFENELFHPEERKEIAPAEAFEELGVLYMSRINKKIEKKRSRNRNKGKSIFFLALCLFCAIFVLFVQSENGKKPTAVSLDSTQTTMLFYQGIHKMDADKMLASAKNCPQAQGYISRVPQIFVVTQMRSAYNFDSGMSTPENWFFFEPDSTKAYSHSIYGLTNFTIDGNSSTLNERTPIRRNAKNRLLKEIIDGKEVRLKNSTYTTHKVHYFLVHTVDMDLVVEEFTTVVELRYIDDRWQIVTLDEVSAKDVYSPLAVSLDFKAAMLDANNDEIQAVNELRKKYVWLPTEESMLQEKQRLDAIGY